jgi:molecular chaperone GrpE (heat shock protein)
MQEVIDEENKIKADLKNTVLKVKTLFESTVTNLSGKLVNIQDVRIQSDIFESGKSQMEDKKQSLESDINTLTDKKNSLNKSREDLIKAMDLLRDKNLFETLTDLLPTGDDIDKINEITTMTAPEIEIVKQGLTAFKKWMQGVGEGFKYSRLQQAIAYKNQDLDSVKEALRDVSKMESVDTARNTVVEEVNKALGSFTTFCNSLDTLIAINMYSEIGKLYQDQLQYLNSIIQEYGKPI